MPLDPAQEDFKYWAFISYSHSDDKWAEWLHEGLETYKVPKHLVGRPSREGMVPARPHPVFRDRAELPGSANLGENIEAALRLSRYLIVICSPRAVHSKWVDKEVRMFKSWGREDRVLCLVVDGEPNATNHPEVKEPECLPLSVRQWVDEDGNITEIPTEPIAADARRGKDGKKNALLKLLAGILGVNFDDLRQRDVERRERHKKAISAGVFALFLVFLSLSIAFYYKKNEAINAQKIAEGERELADKARQSAEAAKKEALAAFEKEQKARQLEADARKTAEAAAIAERDAKLAAEEAAKKEAQAHRQAEDARLTAEQKEQEIRQTLSRSDLSAAAQLIEQRHESKALAYLSRALRYDADNPAVVARVISLLSQRNWPLPLAEPIKFDGDLRSGIFTPDGKWVMTIAGNAIRMWDPATGKTVYEPLKHERKINSVEFSADGKLMVSASDDGTAQMWQIATGAKVGSALQHESAVLHASFSKDGRLVATASQDKTARIWDAATGQSVGNPLVHDRPVLLVVFHPDGHTLVTSAATAARIWDIEKGEAIGVVMQHEGGVYSVEFSPDGKLIATGSGDRTARLWDAVTGTAVGNPMRHGNWVLSVHFSPDGARLVTASSDGTAKIWNVAKTEELVGLKHEAAVNAASFGPNGRWVVTASADGTARIWDAETGEPVIEPLRHSAAVNDARFSLDGKSVVTASPNEMKLWTVVCGKAVVQRLQHEQMVNGVVLTPDGRKLVTVSNDRTARIWDLATGRQAVEPLQHKRGVIAAAISPDGKYLATAADGFVVQLWDVATGKALSSDAFEHGGPVTDLNFSPDGMRLVTASADHRARIWDLSAHKVAVELKHDGEVRNAFFSADGKYVVTGGADKKTRVWDAASGQVISSMAHEGEVLAVAISPDGRWIATGSDDRKARVWDAASGNPVGDPILHASPVKVVSFTPAAVWNNASQPRRWILTGSDKVVRIWETGSGKPVTEPLSHDEAVSSASFSSDGNFIVTAAGKIARVWDANGRPIAEPLYHDGAVRRAIFSSDDHFVVTASADRSARIWFLSMQGTAPAWLGELASAVGGYRLDNFGAAELISGSWDKLRSATGSVTEAPTDDHYAQWARWFVADRTKRPVAAFVGLPVSEFVRQQVEDGSLAALGQALELQPNHALALAKLGRLTQEPARADFLSRLAATYEPTNPEVLWMRALVLQQVERYNDAWTVMQTAIKLDPRNVLTFGPDGQEFTFGNQEGTVSTGWLPKGWTEASRPFAVNAAYAKSTDVPKDGLNGLAMKISGENRAQALLQGPHFICPRNVKCTIDGWIRSSTRTDVNVILTQFVDSRQRYREQVVHGTVEWRPFKIVFVPPQDIAAELQLQIGVGEVDLAGISVWAQ